MDSSATVTAVPIAYWGIADKKLITHLPFSRKVYADRIYFKNYFMVSLFLNFSKNPGNWSFRKTLLTDNDKIILMFL